MHDPLNKLEALFQACLVRVTGIGDAGSGAWVAPDLVLTCAHVAPQGEATVWWRGQPLNGTVLGAAPGRPATGGGLWPAPDMALIEVTSPPDHPCVKLGDHQINTRTELFIIGNSTVWTAALSPSDASGRYGGVAAEGGWRFLGDEVTPGMSGGPVLDMRSAAVVGVAKASRMKDTSMGGLIMPLLTLRGDGLALWQRMWREHDTYHGSKRSSWPRIADDYQQSTGDHRRIPSAVTSREMAELLAALVPVEALRTPAEFIRAAGGMDPSEDEPPLRFLRDVAIALADAMPRVGSVHPLLRFVVDVSRDAESDVAQLLRRWGELVASRRGELDLYRTLLEEPERDDRPGQVPVITVKIVPSAQEPERYLLKVWREEPNGVPIKAYEGEHYSNCAPDLGTAISAQVLLALRKMQGRAMLEFVVPPELFDFEFENLPVGRSRLGRLCAVVLRDLERLEEPESWDVWRTRWQKLHAGTETTERLRCTDPQDMDDFELLIRGKPELATLIFPGPPVREGDDLLGLALYAGVPAAVWPRRECLDHEAPTARRSSDRCTGQSFQDRFEQQRYLHGSVTLPSLVQSLRVGPDSRCRDVALLWDDPDRILDYETDLEMTATHEMKDNP